MRKLVLDSVAICRSLVILAKHWLGLNRFLVP